MRILAIAVLLIFSPAVALADGIPLKHGRYSRKVLSFALTKAQKNVIDQYRMRQLEHNEMNIYTPYVLTLTRAQAVVVRQRVGYAPSRFDVYETNRGFNDAGPHWNVVLRYSNDRIEVPIDLLLNDRDAALASKEQGWAPFNPCFPDLSELPNPTFQRTAPPPRN